MKKTLLLDIDYTLITGDDKPRPYLKEFLTEMRQHFNIYFYTAGSPERVTDMCRVLYHDLGMDDEWTSELNCWSLHKNNCPMINYKKPDGSYIEVKCLAKAAEVLNVSVESILLLDDNPCYDHPQKEQVIQAHGYFGQPGDKFLRDIMDKIKSMK